jgi:hypothetical protein
MSLEVDNMDIHFNKCASDYDRHSYPMSTAANTPTFTSWG